MSVKKVDDSLEYTLKEEYIVFRVSRNKFVGKSSSGKMEFLCNTHGWTEIEGFTANIMIGKKIENPKKPKGKGKADIKDIKNWEL